MMPRAIVLAWVLAAVLAATSAAALLRPEVYAAEPPAWRVQIVVQDVVDLVLAPLLAFAAWRTLRGSRFAALALGGLFLYATYNLVIYAFAVRLNALFLAYCASLGLAVYGSVLHFAELARRDVSAWFGPRPRVRFPAGLLVALATVFAVLWVLELVPAALAGTRPASLEGTGLLTNPVHALDLSVTLPTLFLAGIALWRRQAWGFVFAPALLVFAFVTDLAIAAIVLASVAAGLPGEPAVAVGIGAAAVVTAVAILRLAADLRHATEPHGGPPAGSPRVRA